MDIELLGIQDICREVLGLLMRLLVELGLRD